MSPVKLSKKLILVESPHKAKIIQKFLGDEFLALSTLGHVRDLVKSGRGENKMGINIKNNYEMTYEIIKGKEEKIKELRKASHESSEVYLAPDPDREGEAIAWHLKETLGLSDDKAKRITYQAVTKKTILEALKHARPINMNLVNAQQARRALDRIVGFNLSPFLWKKVAKNLSAGRVQSPAVRMIVKREKEITIFKSQEYWSIAVNLKNKYGDEVFQAQMTHWKDKRFELGHPDAQSQITVDQILTQLQGKPISIKEIETKDSQLNPYPPFITSTLQQAANILLRFGTSKTMRVAQRLYEGIEINKVATGLITYMRTDSTKIDSSAIEEVRSYIDTQLGGKYLPSKPLTYTSSNKKAQEAHEAIRPVSVDIKPEDLKNILSGDEWNLYDLIWRRFVQSQMLSARFTNTTARLVADEAKFEAKGRILLFDGFLLLDRRGSEEGEVKGEQYLPDLRKVKDLETVQWFPLQHFTRPPSRYTEASLVKSLEKEGIGRPSTYAPIIKTILDRGYVIQKSRAFYATELGIAVNDMLERYFHDIVDYKFTASMENHLDSIEEGKKNLVEILDDFYYPFKEELDCAMNNAEPLKGRVWNNGEKCPICDSQLVVRYSKSGAFLGCSKYPTCKGLLPMPGQQGDSENDEQLQKKTILCSSCGSPMLLKQSKFKRNFYACSQYPTCKTTVSADSKGDPMILPKFDEQTFCEKCGKPMAVKIGKRGLFLACTGYPECKSAKPIPKGS